MTDRAAAIAELRKHWSFDEDQQHTHTWHNREDYIEGPFNKLLYGHEDALAAKDQDIAYLELTIAGYRQVGKEKDAEIAELRGKLEAKERQRLAAVDRREEVVREYQDKLDAAEHERDEAREMHAAICKELEEVIRDSGFGRKSRIIDRCIEAAANEYSAELLSDHDNILWLAAKHQIVERLVRLKSTPSGTPGDVEQGVAHPGCDYLATDVCNKCGWVKPKDMEDNNAIPGQVGMAGGADQGSADPQSDSPDLAHTEDQAGEVCTAQVADGARSELPAKPSDLILRRDAVDAVGKLKAYDIKCFSDAKQEDVNVVCVSYQDAVAAIEAVPENPDAIRDYLRRWPDVLLYNEHLQHIRVETERRVRENIFDVCVEAINAKRVDVATPAEDAGKWARNMALGIAVQVIERKRAEMRLADKWKGGDADARGQAPAETDGCRTEASDTPPGGRVGVRCEGEAMGKLVYAGKGKPVPNHPEWPDNSTCKPDLQVQPGWWQFDAEAEDCSPTDNPLDFLVDDFTWNNRTDDEKQAWLALADRIVKEHGQ